MRLFNVTHIDFLRWRWHAVALSTLIIVAGVVHIARVGIPLGIDFSGGTIVVLKFSESVAEDAVRSALNDIPGEKVVQQYGQAADNEILVRMPQSVDVEQGANLEQDARRVLEAVEAANVGPFEVISTEIVGPVIGKDLQRKGIFATITSLLGIALYIAFRFRPSFAVGAIAASAHDIVVTVVVLSFLGYDLSLNVIAAILAIAGYSVNDTIVIFDRIRENTRTLRSKTLYDQSNLAVNQTLARTVITSGTTFAAVLALYIFGGEVLAGFAMTMLIGVVAGTYSTVFIAASLAIAISKGTASRMAPTEGTRRREPSTTAQRRERRERRERHNA